MSALSLTLACVQLAQSAGDAIRQQQANLDIQQKTDDSPVTNADLASERIIMQGLAQLSSDPILSEESFQDFQLSGDSYWCVDPLDGTRDFINNTGDYTVNIALMEKGQPVIGVVHLPHSNQTYFADHSGAYKSQNNVVKKLNVGKVNPKKLIALISRFHVKQSLIDCLRQYPEIELLARGSSLKVCSVAEGHADFYPRLTPCHDWDIAASHCILRAAGGEIFDLTLKPLAYNTAKPWLLNGLIAVNDTTHNWKPLVDNIKSKSEQ